MGPIVASVVSVALLLVFGWVAALNWWNVVNGLRGRKTGSFIPFLGGFCGVFGMIFSGIGWLGRWAWVPLVVDFGTIPLFLWTIVFMLFGLPCRGKRPPVPPRLDG
jgi:hypothetical protein